MAWSWWRMKTIRERLLRKIEKLDGDIRAHVAAVPRDRRCAAWHESLDALLKKRGELMAQRDLGFMITDRRKVRG